VVLVVAEQAAATLAVLQLVVTAVQPEPLAAPVPQRVAQPLLRHVPLLPGTAVLPLVPLRVVLLPPQHVLLQLVPPPAVLLLPPPVLPPLVTTVLLLAVLPLPLAVPLLLVLAALPPATAVRPVPVAAAQKLPVELLSGFMCHRPLATLKNAVQPCTASADAIVAVTQKSCALSSMP